MGRKSLGCQPRVWWGSWMPQLKQDHGHFFGWFFWRESRWTPGLAHRDSSAPDQWWSRASFKLGIGALRMKMMEWWKCLFLRRTSIFVVVVANGFLSYNLPDSWKIHPVISVIDVHPHGLITPISNTCCLLGAEISFPKDLWRHRLLNGVCTRVSNLMLIL